MIDLSKYRFKTEVELIKQYGNSWRSIIGNTYFSHFWIDNMNILLGKKLINLEINQFNENEFNIYVPSDNHTYYFNDKAIKNCEPNYKPKVLIYT
jgi:hypothetical protein